MNEEQRIDDMARHAYVDGRMDADLKQFMARYLASHPEEARKLQAWRKDADNLKDALQQAEPPINPALDPAVIRRHLQERNSMRWRLAASVLIALAVGGLSGWNLNSDPSSRLDVAAGPMPMQDAMNAYRIFAANPSWRADVRGSDTDLQQWMAANFSNAQRLPDLSLKGFYPKSARMLVTEQGPAAVVIYENGAGQRTGFYIRPPGPGNRLLPKGHRQEGPLVARYWSGNGYNYALVGADSVVMNKTG